MMSPALAWTWISGKPRFAVEQDFDRSMCQRTAARFRKRPQLESWPENYFCGPVGQRIAWLQVKTRLDKNNWRGNLNPTSKQCRTKVLFPTTAKTGHVLLLNVLDCCVLIDFLFSGCSSFCQSIHLLDDVICSINGSRILVNTTTSTIYQEM